MTDSRLRCVAAIAAIPVAFLAGSMVWLAVPAVVEAVVPTVVRAVLGG